MRIVFIAIAAIALGGCATVVRGTTDQVMVDSDPPGAQAVTSEGHSCPATPCTFEVNRKAEFAVSFTKEGYQRQEIPVTTHIASAGAAGFAGNLLVGGVVGMGVDAVTGATLEHVPNPVRAVLIPAEPMMAPPRGRTRRRPGVAADAPQT